MNRCYRLLWNRARQLFVVASEISRGRCKAGRSSRAQRLAWLAVLPLSLSPVLGMAMAVSGAIAPAVQTPRPVLHVPPVIGTTASPSGGHVTAGSGHISQNGLTTTIDQHSQNLSLNWQSFNVGADSTVNFVQPNAQSIAVNRIADPNGSVILGRLNANGQVFLINPNGVLFGKGAQVNVGGLVASTLDVSDSELGRGTRHFGGAVRGSVTNLGTLTAAPGGYVALLGHTASNQGAIHAPAGSVALAGGSAVTLSFDGNHLLDMQIDASTLNALAENKQLIVADGGQVLMSAGAKDSLLAGVVNNSGTIQAQTVQNRAGKIVLLGGMTAGTTHVAGTLDASAPDGGNGGFIETSAAHVQVADGAKISTVAATGNNGSWLIDPHDFTIAPDKVGTVASGAPTGDISGATLNTALGSGNITILSSQGSNASGSGDINVNDAVSWSANTLTLTAANDVNINAVMTASGSAGLVLYTGTGNGADSGIAGGTVNVMPGQGGRVDFTGSSNALSINSQPYTIITSLGTAALGGTNLQGISVGLGGHYALGANIDASATATWNDDGTGTYRGFYPLGQSTPFTGIFDGLGHTISGLIINWPSTNQVGLFSVTGVGSAVRNLGLLGGSVKGQNFVGALVGYNSGGTISQAYATGAANGSNLVGGLVGGNNGTISQAYAIGAVGGSSGFVGGLVGYNYTGGTISQAHATGVVSGNGDYVGGLAGINDGGTISQAYASGAVGGTGNYVGGLLGFNNTGTISQTYATGAVNGSGNYVGGLLGYNNAGMINQAYATGAVSGTGSDVGGLVGYNEYRPITNSYWDAETTGQASSAGGTGLTTTALIAALPAGFASSVWGNGDNQTTPYLLGMDGNQVFNVNDLPTGTVTATNRPNLYTALLDVNQLQAVDTGLADRYVLGNDIDASATVSWNGGAGFDPVGGATAFTGIFDGLGHTISGLVIDRPGTSLVGLFGHAGSGSEIRNIGLLGGSVSGLEDVGGLVGYNDHGTITQAYTTGTVTGAGNSIGGLVGMNSYGTITQAYAAGAVSGAGISVGGLVGYSYYGTIISQAYATGAVSGNGVIGGLVGQNVITPISQAYATGTVSGTGNSVGGLVGFNNGSAIGQAYATGAVSGNSAVGGLVGQAEFGTITEAYANGAVNGSSGFGGLIGTVYGTYTVIGNSYWATDSTGQIASAGGGTGLTTAQMMDPASFAAWGTSISAVGGSTAAWRIYAGDTAPLLRAFMTGLAVTAADVGTTYNGTAFAGSSSFIFGALTPGYWLPSTSVDASLILGDANANASTSTPAINAGSYALAGDLYSGQMGYDIDFTAGTLTIGQAALTISSSDVSKTYDGGLGAAGAAVVSSGTLFGSDTLSGGNFAFTDKNAGTGKHVTVNGVTVSDGNNGGNYAVTYANNTTSTITALGVTVDAAGINRVYDGTTADAIALASAGVLSGDTVNFTGAGSFADKNVGTTKAVGVSGIVASGADANNYSFNTTAATTAAITALGITVDATGTDRVYDGSTADAVALASTGVLSGDTVNFTGTGSFTDKNVGTAKAVGVNGIVASGADAGNYSYNTTAATTADITAKTITINTTGVDKVYDGSTAATIAALGTTGLVAGDVVTFDNASAAFDDKNAGTGKTVTVSGIAASGADADNYSYNTVATTTANITPATLTYRADDASFQAGQVPGNLSGTVTGLVGGDTLADATDGTLTWNTPANAASPAGQYAIDGNGLSALNYVFAQAPGNATALQLTQGEQVQSGAPLAVTRTVAGLQQQEEDTATGHTPHAPNIQIVGGGVRLP